MQVRPLADELHLAALEPTGEDLAGGDFDHGLIASMARVEVRHAVVSDVHVDDDAVKGRKPGHAVNVPMT